MKKRFVFNFPLNSADEPVTYVLIKEYDLKINILKAAISPEKGGELLVELDGTAENLARGLDYLKSRGVGVDAVDKKILFRKDECIHCGACTATCFPGALTIGNPGWELAFDAEKCVVCEMCLKSCPLKLFAISFGH